jgi:hypothetical protein
MEKQRIIKSIFALLVFLSLLFINSGSARSESEPALSKAQSQATYADKQAAEDRNDPNWQEDKSGRFKELEWIIKQNLLNKYQRLEEASLTIVVD